MNFTKAITEVINDFKNRFLKWKKPFSKLSLSQKNEWIQIMSPPAYLDPKKAQILKVGRPH